MNRLAPSGPVTEDIRPWSKIISGIAQIASGTVGGGGGGGGEDV